MPFLKDRADQPSAPVLFSSVKQLTGAQEADHRRQHHPALLSTHNGVPIQVRLQQSEPLEASKIQDGGLPSPNAGNSPSVTVRMHQMVASHSPVFAFKRHTGHNLSPFIAKDTKTLLWRIQASYSLIKLTRKTTKATAFHVSLPTYETGEVQ